MIPHVINGLPAHVLYVHAVVVLVPLTAVAVAACAVWPAVMRKFGVALPVLALVTLAAVPLTTNAGEWLQRHVDDDPLVRKHADLGDGLLPWMVGVFVMAVAVWGVHRFAAKSGAAPVTSGDASGDETDGGGWSHGTSSVLRGTPLRVAAVVLSVAVGAGAVVQVYRIGESGARAAWHDGYSQTATGDHG